MQPFQHATAGSAAQAVDLLQQQGARIIAGGTDLLPLMKEGRVAPARLVDLKPARELRYLRFEADGALRIGALATLADLERSAEVQARLPILVQAVRDAATPQLRAAATVGGNLLQRPRCWYFRGDYLCWLKGGDRCFARDGENEYHAIFQTGTCVAVHPSDLAPALVALDAEVTIEGPSGRRAAPVASFLAPPTEDRRVENTLAPGELIVEIRVPAQAADARGVYLKMMEREAWAFALVSVAAILTVDGGTIVDARIVLGGVDTVPWRSSEAEHVLAGKPLTPELAADAAARAVEQAQPLAENGYKVPMARELVRRAILQAGEAER
jgi:xanthine dehydrogenase YagS FAD-binding subunit